MSKAQAAADRIPPYDERAEKSVIGSVLVDPERSVQFLRGAFKMRAEEIYQPQLRMMFEQVVAMSSAGKSLDSVTFSSWLNDRGLLEAVGGPSAIDELMLDTPTSAHLEHYAAIVRQKFNVRRIIETCRQTLERCYYGPDAAETIVSHAMAGLQDVANEVMEKPRSNAEVFADVKAAWKRAKETRDNGGVYLPGLATPFARYNEIMGGLQPGLHFFGGKSSSGKTSFILNVVRHLLLQQKPVLMIQLDDTHEDVASRLCSMMAGVSLPALAQGFFKQDAMAKIETEIEPFIQMMPLYVIEYCENIHAACDMARYYRASKGVEAVVIDYVQVLDADGNPRDDERQRLGKIAVQCKRLWKQLRVPVLVVSQTSKFKDAEDDGRRADMTELFGASELAHHATSVMVLKQIREKLERGGPMVPLTLPIDHTGHTKKHAVAGHVAKNKHGPKDCMVMFWMLMKYFQFEETPMIHVGGIDRQQTWEECVQDAQGLHAAQAKLAAGKPGFAV